MKEEKLKEISKVSNVGTNEVPMRRIVILTNGNDIKIEEANVAGKLELTAILQSVINFINQPK